MELENNIRIKATPALLEVNFEALKLRLEEELKRYEIVVTNDTVTDAKKLATELNATRKIIDDRRKMEVAKASEPIRQFDAQMKELVVLCVCGRQNILDQVNRFEDEVRALCRESLSQVRDDLWQKHIVDAEFQKADIDDLVKVSNMTAKNNLTRAARDEIERRVLADKVLQDQTDKRLLELQTKCYEAGLVAPLLRQHVENFLFSDKETYDLLLHQLITVELTRQEQAEARMRKSFEKEHARTETPAQSPAPATSPTQSDIKPSKGKAVFTVTCTFVLEVSEALKENEIANELRRVMSNAGITTLTSVYVNRERGAV